MKKILLFILMLTFNLPVYGKSYFNVATANGLTLISPWQYNFKKALCPGINASRCIRFIDSSSDNDKRAYATVYVSRGGSVACIYLLALRNTVNNLTFVSYERTQGNDSLCSPKSGIIPNQGVLNIKSN